MSTPNRREQYRFCFGSLQRPKAELIHVSGASELTHAGVLLNLSIGGAAILLPAAIPEHRWTEDWFIRFTLRDRKHQPIPLDSLCRIKHTFWTPEGQVHGLQFTPTGIASFEHIQQAIWQSLLEQQALSLDEDASGEARPVSE